MNKLCCVQKKFSEYDLDFVRRCKLWFHSLYFYLIWAHARIRWLRGLTSSQAIWAYRAIIVLQAKVLVVCDKSRSHEITIIIIVFLLYFHENIQMALVWPTIK